MIWIYPGIIETFPIGKRFKSSLLSIAQKDYPGANYFRENIAAIDLDKYEASLHKSQMDNTADAAIGICSEREGFPSNPRLLLIELKINCKSPFSLNINDLIDKEKYSRQILKEISYSTILDKAFFIIFDGKISQQCKSWLVNLNRSRRIPDEWESFSPEDFYNLTSDASNIGFSPSAFVINLIKDLDLNAKSGMLSEFEKVLNFLIDYLYKCRNRYEIKECVYLSEAISEALDNFDISSLNDPFMLEYLAILKEDTLKKISNPTL